MAYSVEKETREATIVQLLQHFSRSEGQCPALMTRIIINTDLESAEAQGLGTTGLFRGLGIMECMQMSYDFSNTLEGFVPKHHLFTVAPFSATSAFK